jgi:hypothetical protein
MYHFKTWLLTSYFQVTYRLLLSNPPLTSFIQTFRFQLVVDTGMDLHLLYPTKFW